jgi:hypothetical protein
MPSSVQKILFHGSLVISAALLPISQMFKEAQEARNKDLKNIRENYSRKCSRIVTNGDLLHGLLVSFDPVIFSLRKLPPKKISSFSQEVLQLLKKIVQVQVCGRAAQEAGDTLQKKTPRRVADEPKTKKRSQTRNGD